MPLPPSRSTTRRLAAIMDPRPDAARDAALLIREAPRQLFYANTADRSGAYLRLSSMLAHACATAELAWSLPGSVAQPPFSTKSLCSQELLTFLSSARFAAAPEACWNLSTQMEARAAMPPVIALFSAILFAVADSDLFRPGITTRSRTVFRCEAGHRSEMKP